MKNFANGYDQWRRSRANIAESAFGPARWDLPSPASPTCSLGSRSHPERWSAASKESSLGHLEAGGVAAVLRGCPDGACWLAQARPST